MSPLRLVLVTRRFWPRLGSVAKTMAHLAVALAGRGCRVTVLTARWNPNRPARIHYHEVPVIRLAHRPQGGWETFRYMRSLARWLQQHEDRYELVYVSGLKHEAYAALGAVRPEVPVVLRPEAAGRFGDCLWQIDAAWRRRIKRRCMQGAAFIGPSRALQQELKAAGYPRPRIHLLPDGVPIPSPRSPTAQAAARAVVAEANVLFEVLEGAPVAVYAGRIAPGKGLKCLIDAWRPIVARWPGARLWLAGDGPARTALARQIEVQNLVGRVVMIGVLDELSELLCAADLFVLPGPHAGTSLALLEAMAAGLPIVAGDCAGNRAVITDGRHGLLVPAGDAEALAGAIGRLLDDRDLAARLAAAARRRAGEEFSLAKTAEAHITLFERLLNPNERPAGAPPARRYQP